MRFVARFDHGRVFRFAPIGGDTFDRMLSESERTDLPDSVLVLTPGGHLLDRSEGALYVLRQLGRPWRWLGAGLALIPRRLRDLIYDFIARHRRRFSPEPPAACPIVPPEQRQLFEA